MKQLGILNTPGITAVAASKGPTAEELADALAEAFKKIMEQPYGPA